MIPPNLPTRTAWRVFALVPYVCIALVFLVSAGYAFPQTDDFCTFARLHQSSGDNPLIEGWYLYQNWSGRYTANTAVPTVGWVAGVLPLPGQWVYALSLMLFVIAFLWSCVQASRLVSADRTPNAALGWLLFGCCLALMPSKLEGVLWLTGVAVYSLSLILLPLLMVSVQADDDAPPSVGAYPWRSMVLIAVAVGTNEFVALIIGGFLVLRVVLHARGRQSLRQNASYFGVYLASVAVSILAPGNFVRDATISTQRHDLGSAIRLSQDSLTAFLSGHIVPNTALLCLIAAATVVCGWTWRIRPVAAARLMPICLSLLLGFALHLFVYAYLTGEAVPGRVLNQAYALCIIGVLLLAAWTGAQIAQRRPMSARRPALALIGVTGLLLLTTTSMRDVAVAARTFGPIWKTEQLAREQLLYTEGLKPGRAVPLAPFTREVRSPPILQGADISKDTAYWVNRCVADYYGVGAVQLR